MLTKCFDEKYEDWEKYFDTEKCERLYERNCIGCKFYCVCNDYVYSKSIENSAQEV